MVLQDYIEQAYEIYITEIIPLHGSQIVGTQMLIRQLDKGGRSLLTDGKENKFWHIIGFDENNDYIMCHSTPGLRDECKENCISRNTSQRLTKNMSSAAYEMKYSCAFRSQKIGYIPFIIELSNENKAQVFYWKRDRRSKEHGLETKHYFRFKDREIDYVIIFKQINFASGDIRLLLITAFPITQIKTIMEFKSDYNRAKGHLI